MNTHKTTLGGFGRRFIRIYGGLRRRSTGANPTPRLPRALTDAELQSVFEQFAKLRAEHKPIVLNEPPLDWDGREDSTC